MFFVLSKTVAFLLLPSNLLILLGLAGVVLLATRFKHIGRWFAIVSLVLLALTAFFPLGNLLNYVLESRFPPWNSARGAPDGIVVLGGAISSELSQDFGEPIVGGDADRIFALAKLARAYPDARIVYSGGDASLLASQRPEADFLYPLLDRFGIPRARVTLESRSRNTAENAVFTVELVKPRPVERWLLVTSAQHMPRAIGSFRRAGFAVEAYPVAWHTSARSRYSLSTGLGGGLATLDSAVHEWTGLIVYWLTGRTSELLPGPASRD